MKKLSVWLCMLLWSFATGLIAQIPSSGLVAYYPMGAAYSVGNPAANHLDLSGNNFNLTCINSLGYQIGRTNASNQAATFSANNGNDLRFFDYAGNESVFNQTTDFTVAAWVKLDATLPDGYQSVVQVGENSIFLRFYKTVSSTVIQAGTRRNATTGFYIVSANINLPDYTNAWNFLTCKREGAELILFVNGVEVARNSGAIANVVYLAANKNFTVGNITGYGAPFHGAIQDVFYYSRALTDPEITKLACNVPELTLLAAPSADICPGSGVSILASPVNNPVSWYSTQFGTGSLFTGCTYNLMSVANTTTYFAEATNGQCASYPRNQIQVRTQPVNNTPTENLTVCTGSTTTLTALGNNLNWFAGPVGGVALATGNTFTTPVLNANTTFYVEDVVCNSGRVPISVQVNNSQNPDPTLISPSTVSVCKGTSASLNASGTTTLYWYDAPTGGNMLGTGNSFATPVINAPTTFYVQTGTGACASNRVAANVTLNVTPTGIITMSNDTIRATNLYSSYILRKDGAIVASSNTTGSFVFPVTDCGNYQATFTNTTNNCTANLNVSFSSFTYNSPNSCEGRLFLSGPAAAYPVKYTILQVGMPGVPTVTDTQDPVNWNLSNNTTCTAINGASRYAIIQTPNQCQYVTNAFVVGGINSPQTLVSTSDTTTSCSFTSNIISVTSLSNAAPTNTTPVSALTICAGDSTTLTASGTGTLYWFDVPTGGTELTTGTSINTRALTANKTYYVQSGNGLCASNRTPITVTVNALPVASVNPASENLCSGQFATLSASGGTSYVWSNGATTPDITVAPATTTVYTVTITNAANCSVTRSIPFNVRQPSFATISQTICFGDTYVLNGTSYSTTNNYNQTLTNYQGCDSTLTLQLTVLNQNVNTLAVQICNNDTYLFDGQTLSQSVTYQATRTGFNGCDSIVDLNLTVLGDIVNNVSAQICTNQSYNFNGQSLTQPGAYNAVFTTGLGCDSTVNLTLSVVDNITAAASASICDGDSYAFDGQQLTVANTYTGTFTSFGGCDSTVTLTLSVNPLPTPTVTANNANLSTQTFDAYQWLLNGNPIQGADQQTYTATQSGNYSVVVTDANGCESTSSEVTVSFVGIQESESTFLIYPNPTAGMLNLKAATDIQNVRIFTIDGRLVMVTNLNAQQALIDISNLTQGVYIIELQTQQSVHRSRIVKN